MAIITIIMPVSRPDYLDRIFAQLDMMPCNRQSTNIVVIVDGDMRLFEIAQRKVTGSNFARKLCVYRNKGRANVGSVRARRQRIADIHNEFKQYIKECDYVFSLEDDTLFPLNTLEVLLKDYSLYPYAGFITGLELGRWGWTSIGAYTVNDVYESKVITSIPDFTYSNELYFEDHIKKIDAGGLYGCLIKRQNYMNHEFKPFEDILGPDVDFGLALRRAGLLNYADFSLRYRHLTKQGEISFSKSTVVQVEITKENDSWSQKQI